MAGFLRGGDHMDKLRQKRGTVCLFVLPAVICYLLIAAFPLGSSVVLSFTDWGIAGIGGLVGFKNYVQLFTVDKIFQNALVHTIQATLLCLIMQIPFAILLAWFLTKLRKGRNFFKVAFFIPNMISSAAIGILWSFIYHPQMGLLNSLLRAIGLENLTHVWIGEPDTALMCAIIVASWQHIGYHMIIYLCAMQNISSDVMESAMLDGASSWQLFWKITLPLIVPILKVDMVLVATGSLRIFDIIFVMTGGGPNHASEMVATHMYTRAFKGMQFGYGSAMAVILMIMCLLVTALLNKAFQRAEERIE